MKKAKGNVTPIVPVEELLKEYDFLREQKKTIEGRMKYLADQIKENAQKVGVRDDKGSFYAENESFIYGKQAKKSVSFDKDKAIQFFKDNDLNDCISTVEVINEGAVEEHINSGDISFESLEEITVTKVSYAIDIKKKEEMPEVEQTSVPMAASKKPLLIPRGGK